MTSASASDDSRKQHFHGGNEKAGVHSLTAGPSLPRRDGTSLSVVGDACRRQSRVPIPEGRYAIVIPCSA